MAAIRHLFQSSSQKQVEAEARNIGLAHTIRDLITGANHETHVDSYQKKKAVKALQKAPPAQVNDLITILKAMPDPTVVEFKDVHSREASKHHTPPEAGSVPGPSEPLPSSSQEAGSSTSGQNAGTVDNTDNEAEDVKAPSSWWAVSFSSLWSSRPSTSTTTTTTTTITVTEDLHKSAMEISASASNEADNSNSSDTTMKTTSTTNANGGTVTTTTTTIASPASADKSILVSTLNSIKQQIAALQKAPPTNVISAYTYWWGYEIYVPHKCMNKLQRVSNTSQIFFGFLSGAVTGIPGLAALVPLSRIISAWVGFQWAVINAEDVGKGVVLSATWVLPVALAPRSWDHPGTEDDLAQNKKMAKSKMKQIKAA
ncbi:hypothetical protein EMPS_10191 [Entomortierella parvispora]|uniref:Uncharacterized protein n=1 Tax=Entomortierella parvispora TaxID=205924 RepID=A0A9P3HJK1_9FUNG|nr:hypothetical protein EMPS_10191 [Entomortierella parvispora]